MKKAFIIFSSLAILGFVSSCMKQSPDFGPDELEIVFEELEGTGTKAALTEINLDKYGSFLPSSQTLTARLQYAKTKEKVSGQIEYLWKVNGSDAVKSNVDRDDNSINVLTAQDMGTGTVSVSATYKGQQVQSSDVPIKVTANKFLGITLDVGCQHFKGYEYPINPSGNNTLTPIPGIWRGILSTAYRPVNMTLKVCLNYLENDSVEKKLDITDSDALEVSIPDFPDAKIYIDNASNPTLSSRPQIWIELGEDYTYNGNYFGMHNMTVKYKNFSEDYDFEIVSDLTGYEMHLSLFKKNGVPLVNDIPNNSSYSCNDIPGQFEMFGALYDKDISDNNIFFGHLNEQIRTMFTVVFEKGSTQKVVTATKNGNYYEWYWPGDMTGTVKVKIFYFNQLIYSSTINVS